MVATDHVGNIASRIADVEKSTDETEDQNDDKGGTNDLQRENRYRTETIDVNVPFRQNDRRRSMLLSLPFSIEQREDRSSDMNVETLVW